MSFFAAIIPFVENEVKKLIDLVHPAVSSAIADISKQLATAVQEVEMRVSTLEANLIAQVVPALEARVTKLEQELMQVVMAKLNAPPAPLPPVTPPST